MPDCIFSRAFSRLQSLAPVLHRCPFDFSKPKNRKDGKNHENTSDTIKFNFDVKEAYYTNLREEKTEDIKVENNTINVKELSHCKFVTICVKAKQEEKHEVLSSN